MMRSAAELLEELNSLDESSRIEAKRSDDIGKSQLETVIAFANEPGLGGGFLLLGVDWNIDENGDTVYRAVGLSNPDKIQRDLASQCANALNVALRPEMQLEQIDGKPVLVVYVREADVTQKPIYKKASGLPIGAYRRIGSTDQRCVDEDIWVLRGESQPLHGPDSSIFTDAQMDDFDTSAIQTYRRERMRINPHAEELTLDDEHLLEALGAVRRANSKPHPTLAGIVLFGKSIALRRLLPALRIDYIRVPGNEWVEDPDNRFQSVDIRKPLLLALPAAEAAIVDELPKGFHLKEGDLQSVQQPVLPRKVIREALANAVMHRNYNVQSPTQIIRYGSRIEIRNAGYSLKEPSFWGTPGSFMRNPVIAAVLHDLHLAEAKGTGIRAMRRLATDAGLPSPEFYSDRQANEFKLILFLHHFMSEEDLKWLQQYSGGSTSADEAKVLNYARTTGAVDNTACRDFCGLDTLSASLVLRRLRDRKLLEKHGAGNRTYYVLVNAEAKLQKTLWSENSAFQPEHATLGPEHATLGPEHATLEPEHATLPEKQKLRMDTKTLRAKIRHLCLRKPQTIEQLANSLGKSAAYLRNKHLGQMLQNGTLKFLYPESAKHPHQAYIAVGDDNEKKE